MEYKGQTLQCHTLENNIAELVFDLQDGSVNKFDKNSLQELDEVVKLLGKDQSVKGLLISSGKDSFIVGADINELAPIKGFDVYNFIVAKLAYKILSYKFLYH